MLEMIIPLAGVVTTLTVFLIKWRIDKNAAKEKRQNDNDDWIRHQNVSRAIDKNLRKGLQAYEAKGLDGFPVARTIVTHTVDALLVRVELTRGAPFKCAAVQLKSIHHESTLCILA